MTAVRGHNEGTLFLRSRDKRWVASVTMPDGRRRSASARSKADGVRLLEDLKRQRDAQVVDPRNLTLGTYLRRWLADVRPNLAPETWRKYESHARVHLIPALGHIRLSELSVGACRDYLHGARDLDPQTRRHHRATLRRALADALRDGLIARNVAALAEPPKLSRRERTVLNADQVRVLIEGTRDDRLGPLWTLAATTGMRLGEMLALTWEDVELGVDAITTSPRTGAGVADDRGADQRGVRGTEPKTSGRDIQADTRGAHVRVHATLHRVDGEWQRREPKTAKSRRVVPLPDVTVGALKRIRRLHGLVFTTDKGYPLHGPNLPKELHKATDRLGLPRVGIHDLRHAFATNMIGAGVDLLTVSRILGHSSIRITADIYAGSNPDLYVDAMERMQRMVAG